MMDIVSAEQSYDLRQVTRLQQLKTGALLAASVEDGRHPSPGSAGGRTHLRAYARDIGLAFQIADDLLDVEGDEAKAGKALRKDEEQGKQTFVTLMGVEQARAQATMLVEQAGHLTGHGEDRPPAGRTCTRYREEGSLMAKRIGIYPGTFDPITLGPCGHHPARAKLVDELIRRRHDQYRRRTPCSTMRSASPWSSAKWPIMGLDMSRGRFQFAADGNSRRRGRTS